MTFAVIALGANLGDATSALQGAVDALVATAGVTVVSASPVFETDPVGGPGGFADAITSAGAMPDAANDVPLMAVAE